MFRSASQIAEDVLTKIAAKVDAYGNLMPPEFPTIPVGLGAIMGGAAAHFKPTEQAQGLREMAQKVDMSLPETTGNWDVGTKGKTRFRSSPEMVKKFYLNRALRANALRMLGGMGAGALTGYGLSRLLRND